MLRDPQRGEVIRLSIERGEDMRLLHERGEEMRLFKSRTTKADAE
jgi:hypothetical protein